MIRIATFLTVIAIVVISFIGTAAAEQGRLNAVAYGPVKAGTTITVRPLDNSDANLVLKKQFEQELTRRGYTVSKDASLQLNFDTRDEAGTWTNPARRTVLHITGSGKEGGEDAMARLNLWDSTEGGVLNEGQQRGTRISTPSSMRLETSLEDRSNGKSLWEAWGVAEIGRRDTSELTAAMVPIMIENLGKTVKEQEFTVP